MKGGQEAGEEKEKASGHTRAHARSEGAGFLKEVFSEAAQPTIRSLLASPPPPPSPLAPRRGGPASRSSSDSSEDRPES